MELQMLLCHRTYESKGVRISVADSEAAFRLGLGDAHVIFGHTHRAGPFPGDDQSEWSRPVPGAGPAGRLKLFNTGSWTYNSVFMTQAQGENPYWPGAGVLVEDEGPPVLLRLLSDRTDAQLKPVRA